MRGLLLRKCCKMQGLATQLCRREWVGVFRFQARTVLCSVLGGRSFRGARIPLFLVFSYLLFRFAVVVHRVGLCNRFSLYVL